MCSDMKRIGIIIACAIALAAGAQNTAIVPSSDISEDQLLNVSVDMDLFAIPVKSTQTVIYTPYIANGTDTLFLSPVAVLGRRNYIQYQRGNLKDIVPPTASVFKKSEIKDNYLYTDVLEFLPWFDGAILSVKAERYGCAGCSQGTETFDGVVVARPLQFRPADWAQYVQPKAEGIKIRDLEGRANVEFPVNKTVLLSDFRGNYAELDTIKRTIDVVRNDSNCTIKSIAIRGFASPEGPYDNNVRLAKGRTEALCTFVEQFYRLPKGFIKASYEPEDWDGLKDRVEQLDIDNRESILAIIDDSSLEPDARDNRIKSLFPEQYQFLLEHIYPALRHSDYRIEYEVRSFSDPVKILEVMREQPKNLSLEELFVAAQSLEPGTPEFNEVFEVAVRLFPSSEEANLNAGINAMNRGEYDAAAKYLERAGDNADADYARAVLAIAIKDYDVAQKLLDDLAKAGDTRAVLLINELERIKK